MIGYAFCGSFCTLASSLSVLRELVAMGEDVVPIFSEHCLSCDTRFGAAFEFKRRAEEICGRSAVTKIEEAELFGSKSPLEYLIISPCTGNTLAKIANGISDGTVSLAAKAHLRCDRPLLIALSSNDAMSQNLKNIAALITRRNVYFVPMIQDDPKNKPHSLVSDSSLIKEAFRSMKLKEELRPLFLERKNK